MKVTEAGAGGIRRLFYIRTCDSDLKADLDTRAADKAAGTHLMKYITLIAMITIVLLDIMLFQLTGEIPQSSVGGTVTLALAFLVAALAVGIHEASSKNRGVLGWILSIAVAVGGAFLATSLSGIVMNPILMLLNLDESSAAQHPLHFVASAGMMLNTLLGSWIALLIVNRRR